LKDRSLVGVQLTISDACLGLVEAAAELFPDAQWQRYVVHFYRKVFSHVPKGKVADVACMLNPPAHARSRSISGRPLRVDVGRGATATHRAYEVEQAALSRDGNAAQSASRGGSCLRLDRATADESAKDS